MMNLQRMTLLAVSLACATSATIAQVPDNSPAGKNPQINASMQSPVSELPRGASDKGSSRADAYYNYTMGHIYEQQYEATSNPDYATKAIEAYKRAYTLDPKSAVIGERLAEMYWKAQRTKEAEAEAKQILRRNANDLQSRRLLGRIYLRSLENMKWRKIPIFRFAFVDISQGRVGSAQVNANFHV